MVPDVKVMSEGFEGALYKDITNIHPIGLSAVLILGIAMLILPRRWAVLPMIIIACFISSVQKITIAGMDFDLLRIMVVLGVIRLFIHKEYLDFWKPIDKIFIAWVISSMVICSLQQGTFSAFVNRLGFGFDALGMYFLFRCLIRDYLDLDRVVFMFILISIPVAMFFIIENRTGYNMFSIFGGVPEITVIRDGRLRCQGAFSHPIIAGCFWASLMPLFAAYWRKSANGRFGAVTGLVTSSIIVICCSSSTPVLGVIAAVIGGLMFVLRKQMRSVRWGILLSLIALHMVMQAPVWHLVCRVSAVGGSSSYFRFQLIDAAITHFHEWALLGTKSTAHWFWGAQDLCNQYVYVGVRGGFLSLCLFLILIAIAFREVGRMWRQHSRDSYRLALSWAMGVCLYVHCMCFIGVSYFGQIFLIWYMHLAIIGSLSNQESTIRNKKILPLKTF